MKPAGRERNMAANIDALRQNASRGGPGDGSGGTDAHLRGLRGSSSGASMRPRRARCTPMIGEGLKGPFCLQHVDDGPIVQSALGRPSYSPNPRPPKDFRKAQSAPGTHALGGVLRYTPLFPPPALGERRHRGLARQPCSHDASDDCRRSRQVSRELMTPSPPAEKTTARQDQAGQSSTGDGTGDGDRARVDRQGGEIEAEQDEVTGPSRPSP
jgi:hypothetical protein